MLPSPRPAEYLTHDVRSALTVIRGHAQLLRRRMDRLPPDDHAASLAHLDQIERQITAISERLARADGAPHREHEPPAPD